MQKLLRIREVAAVLGVSFTTAKRLVRDGELRKVRIGSAVRVAVDELDRFIAERAVA